MDSSTAAPAFVRCLDGERIGFWVTLLASCLVCMGCGADDGQGRAAPLALRAVTFNTGTTGGLPHDAAPDDGYTSAEAAVSDQWYGDGLAWSAAIEDARLFLAEVDADVVAFQEIFHSGDCGGIPEEFRRGWVCETWQAEDPTVAQTILGAGYQVACNFGRPDKCVGVKRAFGTFRGCDQDLCLDGLDGARVPDCGGGSRVGRGVIDMATGGTLTVVNIHGTSGFSGGDVHCRSEQFAQIFEDLGLGDGAPAANGERNLVLGDFNTDPGRVERVDASAAALLTLVESRSFQFITDIGPMVTPTYAGIFNIDHILSDVLIGDCWAAGVTEGRSAVSDIVYFDHVPIVCDVGES